MSAAAANAMAKTGAEERAEGERGEPAVTVRRLRKRFGYRDVLRGVDLDVPRGACFALLGPNGAGKSTILKIVATHWKANEGDVRVLGIDARRDPEAVRARVGIAFHDSFLRREFTLDENLRFACDLHDVRPAAVGPWIEELLERFGLAHRRGDRVGTFSQGMLRRASLIRSLLHHPELWLLDEPFSGLDPGGQEILMGAVEMFVAGGGTVLLVTHRPATAARLARDAAWLVDGDVVCRGAGALAAAEAAAGAVATPTPGVRDGAGRGETRGRRGGRGGGGPPEEAPEGRTGEGDAPPGEAV